MKNKTIFWVIMFFALAVLLIPVVFANAGDVCFGAPDDCWDDVAWGHASCCNGVCCNWDDTCCGGVCCYDSCWMNLPPPPSCECCDDEGGHCIGVYGPWQGQACVLLGDKCSSGSGKCSNSFDCSIGEDCCYGGECYDYSTKKCCGGDHCNPGKVCIITKNCCGNDCCDEGVDCCDKSGDGKNLQCCSADAPYCVPETQEIDGVCESSGKNKCASGCVTDSNCPGENQGCCKGSGEEKGTCYTKKHLEGEKYVGEKCCSDSCGSNVCGDWRYECCDKNNDGRALECCEPCENSCKGKGKGEAEAETATKAVAQATQAAFTEAISDCRKDKNTKYPPWSCKLQEGGACCNLFDNYRIDSMSVKPKGEKTEYCGVSGTAADTETESGYDNWRDALKVAQARLDAIIQLETEAVVCPSDCVKQLIPISSSMDISKINGKWSVTVSLAVDIKCYKKGPWIAKVSASVTENCEKFAWEQDLPGCVK